MWAIMFLNGNNYNQCISNALNPAVIHVCGSKLCMLNLKQKYERTSQEKGRGMGRGVYPKYCKRYKSTQPNLHYIALSIPTALSHACMQVQTDVGVVGGERKIERNKAKQPLRGIQETNNSKEADTSSERKAGRHTGRRALKKHHHHQLIHKEAKKGREITTATTKKIATHKRFKRTLFIRTKT